MRRRKRVDLLHSGFVNGRLLGIRTEAARHEKNLSRSLYGRICGIRREDIV